MKLGEFGQRVVLGFAAFSLGIAAGMQITYYNYAPKKIYGKKIEGDSRKFLILESKDSTNRTKIP